jgi:hypothetical protein
MTHFTLEDLVNFTQNEKKMVESILPTSEFEQNLEPKEETLRFLMDYSKSLSVRKSKKLKHVSMILN